MEAATVVAVTRRYITLLALAVPLFLSACGNSVSELEASFAKNYLAQSSDALGLSEDFAQCYAQQYLSRVNQTKMNDAGITLEALKREEVALSQLGQEALFDTPKDFKDTQRESLNCFSTSELKRAVGISEDNDDLNKQLDCIMDDLGREQFISFLLEAKESQDPEAESKVVLEAAFTFCKEQLIEE